MFVVLVIPEPCAVGKLLLVSVTVAVRPTIEVGVLLNVTVVLEVALEAIDCVVGVAVTTKERGELSLTPTLAVHCVEAPADNVDELQVKVNG